MNPSSLRSDSAPRPSILIVEDEAIVALDLQGELEALGYDVVGVADTAPQALDMARRHTPSLALMDIMLRGDTDGIAAAEALRIEFGTPVVFLTSFSDAETVSRAARTAAYGYLTKPFQAKELRAGIEVALWKSQMERQLREADRWFALTLRCVQDGVVVTHADGRVRFINPAAEKLTGWAAEQALGQPVDKVVRFDAPGADGRSPVQQVLEEGRVVGVRHGRPLLARDGSGTPVDESAAPVHDAAGRRLGAVLVLRDAAERLRQEGLLRASEERFRSAFELAPLGMALVAMDGSFLQVNDAFCRLLGSDPAWLLHQTQADVSHADDLAHEAARLAELHGGRLAVTQFEKRYLRAPDQYPVWSLVHASILRESEPPAAYLYQVHDLTAQKAAAEQLAELAAHRIRDEAHQIANRSRGAFLSRVSHEMRTPLNAVLGFAELLKLQQARGEIPDAAYSEHILSAGRHLLALVDDVLDLQRADGGTLRLHATDVALDTALPDMVALLDVMAQARQVRIVLQIEPGMALRVDETRLRQIVLNLGSNAVKYNRHGGLVQIAARRRAGRVEIEFVDSGIGMSGEQIEHLFEPFNRLGREALRVPGVGLGLVITRSLVQQMGGTLAVTSAPAEGTTVTVEFPSG